MILEVKGEIFDVITVTNVGVGVGVALVFEGLTVTEVGKALELDRLLITGVGVATISDDCGCHWGGCG